MIVNLDFNLLNGDQRRAFLFARAYEEVRQTIQYGYRLFKEFTLETVTTPVFKQFITVTNWFLDKRFSVSWLDVNTRGYVDFAFRQFRPRIPQPGQLKNDFILIKYIADVPAKNDIKLTDRELIHLYSRVIRPEVLGDIQLVTALGLKDVVCFRNKRL